MTPVGIGDTVTMTGTLTVKATGESYQALTNDVFAVVYKGYGISTEASRSVPEQAWEDYSTEGNADMRAALGY